jgi:cysteine dioxygenase
MNQRLSTPLQSVVDQLHALRRTATIDDLTRILSSVSLRRADVQLFERFNPHCYSRNPVTSSEHFELLCICWRSGQSSLVHDHTGSACGVRVIEGEMVETIFEPVAADSARPVLTRTFGNGYVCGSVDRDIHQISNFQTDGSDLITLHIYSPPLTRMNTFVNVAEAEMATSGNESARLPP